MPKSHIRIDNDRDLVEIKRLIENYMRRTYLIGIEEEIFRCKRRCEERPTQEIEILMLFMSYMPEERKGECKELIRFLQYEQIAREVMPVFSSDYSRGKNTEQDGLKTLLLKVLLYSIMCQKDCLHEKKER